MIRTIEPEYLQVAHAACMEAGHPELISNIFYGAWKDLEGILIKTPCSNPNIAIKAVVLAHQAAGHDVIITELSGHNAHFICSCWDFDSE